MNNPNPTIPCARVRHGFASACVLISAALANVAFASPCPPGYHGTAPHCVPSQAAHHPTGSMQVHAGSFGIVPMHAANPHGVTPKKADWRKTGPSIGPAPVEHDGGAVKRNGIIFVGGKTSLNPQPIPPGKAALNPQPIPPGHAFSKVPHAGPPIKKKLTAEPSQTGNPS